MVQYWNKPAEALNPVIPDTLSWYIAMKNVVLYLRVSTEDQNCERQERDLRAFVERAGYSIVDVIRETASGTKNDRRQRAEVIKLAKGRYINAVLVTELSRWGRSTQDLLSTVKELHGYKVSLEALNGMSFDLDTPQGKLMLTLMSGISEFERDLLAERVKSGMNAAKARGKHCGRPAGKVSDKHAPEVLKRREAGQALRSIAKDMKISPTTVVEILKRHSA